MTRHNAIKCFRRTLADHDIGRYEGLDSPARASPRHSQHPPRTQAGRQLAAQRTSALNEQRLINGLMADAHRLIVREVDRQAAGDLLRAPGVCPPAVLPRPMPTAFPGHGRTGNRSPARSDDDSCQSFLHIGSQCRDERNPRLDSLGEPLAPSGAGCCAPCLGDLARIAHRIDDCHFKASNVRA